MPFKSDNEKNVFYNFHHAQWHFFSYTFLDGGRTARKIERRMQLIPRQKSAVSPAFNMGSVFKMQVTSLLKQPIFFLKWQTSYLKLNGTELFQLLDPSPFYPFTVLGKKIRKTGHTYSQWSDKCRFSASDYGETHLNSWGISAGISCFTFIPISMWQHLNPETPILQGNAISPTMITWQSRHLQGAPHYNDVMSMQHQCIYIEPWLSGH